MIHWQDLKASLIDESPWLSDFNVPFSTAIRQNSDEGDPFDPLQFNYHLGRMREIVTRLQRLESEAHDLEIAAVKSVADHRAFLAEHKLNLTIEKNALRREQLASDAKGFSEAAAAFSDEGRAGDARHMKAIGESAEMSMARAAQTEDLIDQKYERRLNYQTSIYSRHSVPGNAHNYAERLRNIWAQAQRDYAEFLLRARAVEQGIKHGFGEGPDALPAEGTPTDLYVWVENTREKLDRLVGEECEASLLVPLVQPWKDGGSGVMNASEFYEALRKDGEVKEVSFDLSDVFPRNASIRLMSAGASIDFVHVEGALLDQLFYYRARLELIPPKQDRELGAFADPASIFLGNSSVFGRTLNISSENGARVQNLKPDGKWSLRIHRRLLFNANKSVNFDTWSDVSFFSDVKLLFRFRYRQV